MEPQQTKTYTLKNYNPVPTPGVRTQKPIDILVSEMLGLCKGILSDGVLVESEIVFLDKWLGKNRGVQSHFVGKKVIQRISRILADERIDEEERLDLQTLLAEITALSPSQGGTRQDEEKFIVGTPTVSKSISGVFDDPAPPLVFPSRNYCFTGTFVSGKRSWCELQIISRGGMCHSKVSVGTHFLIVGTLASAAWTHSSYGRKIEDAMDFRKKHGLAILSEEYWSSKLAA